MKILIISHTKEHELTDGQLGWKDTPKMIAARGHQVKFIMRHQWKQIEKTWWDFRPDLVSTIGVVGSYACFLRDCNLVPRCPIVHEWTEDYPYMLSKKYWFLVPALHLAQMHLVHRSDMITTASPGRYQYALNIGKKAYLQLYGSEKKKIKPGKKLLDSDRFKIVYVGEQSKQKQTERIVKAVEGLDCDLYLTDKPAQYLVDMASDNVHFLGRLPFQDDVFKVIEEADLCVITENNDSVGKLSEYWQLGKPVLGPAGKLDYYSVNMIVSENICDSITDFIKMYKEGTWETYVKECLVIPKVPTWDGWVDNWLREVSVLVKAK